MLTVGFHQPHLCLRGTTVAMYDYANFNQTILGNKSIVFYCPNHPLNNETVIKKFINANIELVPVTSNESIKDGYGAGEENFESIVKKKNIDILYITKGGKKDSRMVYSCKTAIQAIGTASYASHKHGDIYTYGSKWLSDYCSNGQAPYVPYMVHLPDVNENLRDHYRIPKDAIVFGRTGGLDTWNIPYANAVIKKALEAKGNIYFLFQNTPVNFTHPRIIHVKNTADLHYKTKFINSCDAMIHARVEGESFGLACAEFSIRNKPVITWKHSREKNHILILGEKGIYYGTDQEMLDRLLNFVPDPSKDLNCYREYSPENVMKLFNKVYLSGL